MNPLKLFDLGWITLELNTVLSTAPLKCKLRLSKRNVGSGLFLSLQRLGCCRLANASARVHFQRLSQALLRPSFSLLSSFALKLCFRQGDVKGLV